MSRYHDDEEYRKIVCTRSRARHARLMQENEEYRKKSAERIQLLKVRGENPEKRKVRRRRSRQKIDQQNKEEVFLAYGAFCACCGESDKGFLTIDHIGGGGAEHRRLLGRRSQAVYIDIRNSHFPKETYRILCMNCNWATRLGSLCPHEITLKQIIRANE